MEYNTKKDFIKRERCSDVYSESTAEYTLPDYNGDIRRILFTDACVRPAGKFEGGDDVQFSGIVVYTVVYSDSENNLTSVSFTSDYDLSVKCSSETLSGAFCDTRVANYAVRLLGPRKISAKASVVGKAKVYSRDEISVSGDAFEGDETPEVLTKRVNIESIGSSENVEREYAESMIRLEGAIADEVSVVFSDAEVNVDEIEAVDGGVELEGEISLAAVIRNGDEPARLVTKTVPFEERLAFENVREDMKFFPTVTVSSLTSSVNADDTGSEVVLSLIVDFGVLGEYNEGIELITDAYMKTKDTENEYADFESTEIVDVVKEREAHTVEIPRLELEQDNMREIVFLKSTPKIEKIEEASNGLCLEGEIKYSGIASEMNDDGSISYSAIKFSSPFTKNISNCRLGDDRKIDASVRSFLASATVDADTVYASSTLEFLISTRRETSNKRLSQCSMLEGEAIATESEIVVYYPTSNDTLFSVAKRFRRAGSKIALDNSLVSSVMADGSEDYSLEGVKRLIIY